MADPIQAAEERQPGPVAEQAEQSAPESNDHATGRSALDLRLVHLLGTVLIVGLMTAAITLFACWITPTRQTSASECSGASASFDRRWSEALQTVVTLLAGKAMTTR